MASISDDNSISTFDEILQMKMEEDSEPTLDNSVKETANKGPKDKHEGTEPDPDDFWMDEESSVELSFLKDQPDPSPKKGDPDFIDPDDVDYGHPNDKITALMLLSNGGAILHYGSSRRVYRPPHEERNENQMSQTKIDSFFPSKK